MKRPEVVDSKGFPLPNVPWDKVFEYDVEVLMAELLAIVDDGTKSPAIRERAKKEMEYYHSTILTLPKDMTAHDKCAWLLAEQWMRDTPKEISSMVKYVEPPKAAVIAKPAPAIVPEPDDTPTFA